MKEVSSSDIPFRSARLRPWPEPCSLSFGVSLVDLARPEVGRPRPSLYESLDGLVINTGECDWREAGSSELWLFDNWVELSFLSKLNESELGKA